MSGDGSRFWFFVRCRKQFIRP